MVAEVVRLLGYTENARILTNPATEILNAVACYGSSKGPAGPTYPLALDNWTSTLRRRRYIPEPRVAA